jgi:hypothetical protein
MEKGHGISWVSIYFVSTVGRDERLIREYIRSQKRGVRKRKMSA